MIISCIAFSQTLLNIISIFGISILFAYSKFTRFKTFIVTVIIIIFINFCTRMKACFISFEKIIINQTLILTIINTPIIIWIIIRILIYSFRIIIWTPLHHFKFICIIYCFDIIWFFSREIFPTFFLICIKKCNIAI